MDMTILRAEKRTGRGARANRRLRDGGKMPAVIYGHGEEPENVVVSTTEVASAVNRGTHLVQLDVAGQTKPVLIKDVQYDHLASTPIHIDFMRVDLNQRVNVTVPLEFRGTPIGINEGGTFDVMLPDVAIQCLVTEIPESIRVNIGELKLGQLIHVRELQLPENVTASGNPEAIVCAVRAKTAEEAAAPAAETTDAAEPEIITRREKVEEGEGEAKEKK